MQGSKMKNIFLILLSCIVLTACVAEPEVAAEEDGQGGGNRKPGAAKAIEPGTDLFFSCADEVSTNVVNVWAYWESGKSRLWNVSIEERDQDGRVVMRLTDVTGFAMSDYSMRLKPASYFSLIAQKGADTAELQGMGRTLNCRFR
jgi:hypothetical protein